jgi:aryl-alcohol dehydrogenase-like predicted oxidoreductase
MNEVILGLWPIAGITSGGVTPADSLATIQAALDLGIRTFDTAYSYGFDGESDRMLGEVIRRAENRGLPISVIGKVGQRWTKERHRVIDASPEQLTADAEASLRRIGIERFDWLMLHAVDPNVDVRRSGAAIDSLRKRGLASRIGICCSNAEDLVRFTDECGCSAIQCPLNLFQQESLVPLIRTAANLGSESHVYWTLMKGLLAGRITRDHVFVVGDGRSKYEIFHGESRRRAHEVVDRLALLAKQHDTTVSRLAIGWALSQAGVTAALVGAKRAEQIRETGSAVKLDAELLAAVNRAALP